MPGRLALDFGTSNSVLAAWDEARREGMVVHIHDYGRQLQQAEETISVIPSVIHFGENDRLWIGNQVLQRNLYHSNHTLRWIKRYIINRSLIEINIDGKSISYRRAGNDFLTSLLLSASAELGVNNEEIALSVPVEAYEHYENWLGGAAESANLPRFRLIDEPSAAALGYGAHIQPGDVYLIFDFGGGTLDVAVVLIEPEKESRPGRRCRVLGKAGLDLGGISIDQWLFQEVLMRNGRSDSDEDIRPISNALLVECEALKERLSFNQRSGLSVVDPNSGAALTAEFTQQDFENLLDEHEAFARIDQTIRRALRTAQERGYNEEHIKAVLTVGGSSQIPAVRRTLRRIFGKERVLLNRPLDAIARGAAAFVAGVDFYDYIQHDYAIRFINREKGSYDYRRIVLRGTPYPTQESVARLTVKASYDGQNQLGIAIYELGERSSQAGDGLIELVFDPSGAARVMPVTPDEAENRSLFWMNEANPTFLLADPPARQGEARFEVSFSIDGNKRLLITARDLQSGALTHQNYPVVKLA
jgi:molecular chaperone DnaK